MAQADFVSISRQLGLNFATASKLWERWKVRIEKDGWTKNQIVDGLKNMSLQEIVSLIAVSN